jgi:AraC-like DNA-binding protein
VYFPKVLIFEDFVGIFIFAIYLVKFFKLLKKLKKDNFSIKNYEYYKWIKNLSFIFTIILIVWVLTYVIDYIFFDFGLSFTNYYHVYTLFAFLQFWVIYTGFFSTSRIQPKNFTKKQIGNFSAEELEYFKNIIVTVIQTKKLYLKSDFDIKQLSIETEINVSYLSIILNSEFHMNFHNFINKFRIEYSKKELLNSDNKNKTIEAISKDCGFKSKTTFNAAFKKMTSMTPTEYMKLHNKL